MYLLSPMPFTMLMGRRMAGKKKYMTRSMPLKQFKPDFLTFTKPFYQDLLVTCCVPANVQVVGFAVIIQKSSKILCWAEMEMHHESQNKINTN